MTPADLVEYYQNLLIAQYLLKPKAAATVAVFLTELIANNVITQVQDGFDVTNAVGKQLDAVGTYRGAKRQVYGLNVTKTYWSMIPVADASPATYKGFALVAGGEPSWYWITEPDLSAAQYVMSDGDFRSYIQYLADLHASDHTMESIDALLLKWFGTYAKLIDNGDMTLTYEHQTADPSLLFTLVNATKALPRPAGTSVSVVNI